MGEMAQALKALGDIKDAWLIKNQNDTWSFVGMVDGRLTYIHNDGTEPTVGELQKISSSCARSITCKILKIKVRIFLSKEDAIKAADEIEQMYKEPVRLA